MIAFQVYWILIQWKKYWKYNVRFIFNEKNDYSEEDTINNKEYHSIIFQPFQFEPEQKKSFESHEKETKIIYNSAADLVHIRIGNLNWCKWGRKTKREK